MRKSSGILSKDFDNIIIVNISVYSIIIIMPFIVVPKATQPYIVGKAIYLYLIGILLFLLMLFDRVKHKIEFKFKLEEKILGIFFISLIIATIFSVDIENSLIGTVGRYEGLIMYGIYILVFVSALKYNKISMFMVDILSIASIIMSIYTVLQFYGIDPFISIL